jgi:hypothetical protein
MRPPKFRIIMLLIIFTAAAGMCFGSNVFITNMDLTSRINLDAEIETRGLVDISFDGGYKYQGKLLFQYYNPDLENNSSGTILFDGAQASVLGIFKVLDVTYWTGYYGILGEGKHYKGHLYHRNPGFDYNGYYPVLGTGLILGTHYYDLLGGQIFTYQRYGSSYINSMDVNLWVDKGPITFSLFTGVSSSQYRIGAQFTYSGDITDLYLTAGYPTLEQGRQLNLDDMYLLLEEWFRIKNFNLILSVFTRPAVHYNYIYRKYMSTKEKNDVDFNFDLNYVPEGSNFSGGAELNLQIHKHIHLGSDMENKGRYECAYRIEGFPDCLSEYKSVILTIFHIVKTHVQSGIVYFIVLDISL